MHHSSFTLSLKKDFLTIDVSECNGQWAYGYKCMEGNGGRINGISHEYGDTFPTQNAAVLAALHRCRAFFQRPEFIALIAKYNTPQLSLF